MAKLDYHSYAKCGLCGEDFYENSLFDLIKTLQRHLDDDHSVPDSNKWGKSNDD